MKNTISNETSQSSLFDSLNINPSFLSCFENCSELSAPSALQLNNQIETPSALLTFEESKVEHRSGRNKTVRFLTEPRQIFNDSPEILSENDTETNFSGENIIQQSTPKEKRKSHLAYDTSHLERPPVFDPTKILIPWSECKKSCQQIVRQTRTL